MERKRVTQRDVARAAGVTPPTVSLALRNHPGIPAPTRDRIHEIARKLGYTPDPVLSALASYRWPRSSRKRTVVSIATVSFAPEAKIEPDGYVARVRRGVQARATSLGLAVSMFSLPDYEGNLRRLLRVVRARGIAGLVLLPVNRPVALEADAGWEEVSVVSATTSVLTPRFHRVLPNQAHNMIALLERMRQLGHRRLGAIISEDFDARTLQAYSMALAWFGHRDRILIVAGETTSPRNLERVLAWLRRHKPALVFASEDAELSRQLPALDPRAEIATRFVGFGEFIEQHPVLIGETAVRVLSGLLQDNERGIPAHPQITTIDGVVREDRIPSPAR